MLNLASLEQILISQALERSTPAPITKPLNAAITGTLHLSTTLVFLYSGPTIFCIARATLATSEVSLEVACSLSYPICAAELRSSPAVKFYDVDVSTTALTSFSGSFKS